MTEVEAVERPTEAYAYYKLKGKTYSCWDSLDYPHVDVPIFVLKTTDRATFAGFTDWIHEQGWHTELDRALHPSAYPQISNAIFREFVDCYAENATVHIMIATFFNEPVWARWFENKWNPTDQTASMLIDYLPEASSMAEIKKKSNPFAKPSVEKPGGKVQPEKHTKIKTDRGDFKFREPKPSDWK